MAFFSGLDERQRLYALTAIVALILWVYALFEWHDHIVSVRTMAQQLQGQIARVHAVSKETHWNEYRDQVQRRLSDFRVRAWREESEGRIQARFQDWLTEQLTLHRISVRELAVSQPEALDPGAGEAAETLALPTEMRIVRTRLVLDFQADSFHALLNSISQNEHWVWIERLSVRNSDSKTVELELGALFVIGPREGA